MSDQHTHAGGHSEDSSTGVHGMLLFGEEVLYLSHLPMFASPHNFQVLLEVGLDDAAREAFLSDRHVAGDGIHTFVPQPFPIAELAPRADGPARTSIEGTDLPRSLRAQGQADRRRRRDRGSSRRALQ